MKLIPRIILAVLVTISCIILGAYLTGAEIIGTTVGLVIWVVGIVASVVLFVVTKPKH